MHVSGNQGCRWQEGRRDPVNKGLQEIQKET